MMYVMLQKLYDTVVKKEAGLSWEENYFNQTDESVWEGVSTLLPTI